jgi:hypothetical protein
MAPPRAGAGVQSWALVRKNKCFLTRSIQNLKNTRKFVKRLKRLKRLQRLKSAMAPPRVGTGVQSWALVRKNKGFLTRSIQNVKNTRKSSKRLKRLKRLKSAMAPPRAGAVVGAMAMLLSGAIVKGWYRDATSSSCEDLQSFSK